MSQKPSLYRRLCLLGTHLTTLVSGRRVGRDAAGNNYYEARREVRGRRKRWVVYAGVPEASMVPPEWHGWLHYTLDAPLIDSTYQQSWQIPHQPNMTATSAAYRPPGSQLEGGRRAKATGDYEPWIPA
ncbi:MAG: NADH:ubiquinone oxidoreductase subunit NDUFA12 [Bdellovibrionales bacterium]